MKYLSACYLSGQGAEEKRGPGNYAQSQREYRENFAKFVLITFTVFFIIKVITAYWRKLGVCKSIEKKTVTRNPTNQGHPMLTVWHIST